MTTPMDEPESEKETMQGEAKDWVVHLATGEVSRNDLEALAYWRARSPDHEAAFVQASRLWQALEGPLKAVTLEERSNWARPSRRAFLGGALAASAAAVTVGAIVRPPLGLWPSMTELRADYHTARGEQRRIDLGDQAMVEMNTGTSLDIRRDAGNVAHVELIAGEAALSVAREPVAVVAAEGRISAARAEFIVRREGAAVRVCCLSGTVDVACGGRSSVLEARKQVAYGPSGLAPIVPIDPVIVAGWREGLLIFENERLSAVIDEVNRYRSGRIILTNTALGDQRVTARFKIARLDAVLTQFQSAFGARVTSLPGGIILLG